MREGEILTKTLRILANYLQKMLFRNLVGELSQFFHSLRAKAGESERERGREEEKEKANEMQVKLYSQAEM